LCFSFLPNSISRRARSEPGWNDAAWNRWRFGCADLHVEQEVAPRERTKGNRGRTALEALDAGLGRQTDYVWTGKREFRLKRRDFDMIVFSQGVGVKENRAILLCKKSGETRAGLDLLFFCDGHIHWYLTDGSVAAAKYRANSVTRATLRSYSLRGASSGFGK
jgi:hypothetical protein